MRGGTHLARVDLLAGEGVVVGTHVGGVGVDCGLVVENYGWSREFRAALRPSSDGGCTDALLAELGRRDG